jgi:hypothetical protein
MRVGRAVCIAWFLAVMLASVCILCLSPPSKSPPMIDLHPADRCWAGTTPTLSVLQLPCPVCCTKVLLDQCSYPFPICTCCCLCRQVLGWDNAHFDSGADALASVLESVRLHGVSLPGHICAVVVTTLILEGWSNQLDPSHSVLTQVGHPSDTGATPWEDS